MTNSAKKTLPAHQRIYNALVEEIKTLHSNARLPTELELAATFGVSRLTAHKAVMRLQQEGLVVRRRRGGTFVSAGAQRITTADMGRYNGTLVIVHPNWFSYDYWGKADHAVRFAARYHVQTEKHELSPDFNISDLLKQLQNRTDIRGILLLPPGGALTAEDRDALRKTPHPCVMLSLPPKDDDLGIHWIATDYAAVGDIAARALIGRGHTRLAYLSNEPWYENSRILRDTMRDTVKDAGLPASALTCPERHHSPWLMSDDAAYKAACTALQRAKPPTGWLLDSVTGGIALMRAFSEHGIRCPGDASFIVASAVPPMLRYFTPEMATIAVPPVEFVEKAFNLLLKPPRAPQVHLLKPVLTKAASL